MTSSAPPLGVQGTAGPYRRPAGMTPADAIIAATGNAADLIGVADTIGSIRPGRYADLIAVTSDPLADIKSLEQVSFVMKGGTVFKLDNH